MSVLHSPTHGANAQAKEENYSDDSQTFQRAVLDQFKLLNEKLSENMTDITTRISALETEIRQSVHEAFGEIRNLKESIKSTTLQLNQNITSVKEELSTFSTDIAKLHYLTHCDQLQIFKLPEVPDEELDVIFNKLCVAIGISIPPVPQAIFRVKNNAVSHNVVIVKFFNAVDRNIVFQSYMKNLKKCNTNVLNFSTNSRIFMAESLHESQRRIFNKAQALKSAGSLTNVRTRNGLTFVKFDQQTNFMAISSIEQLSSLNKADSNPVSNGSTSKAAKRNSKYK